jgi:hypothetical protein
MRERTPPDRIRIPDFQPKIKMAARLPTEVTLRVWVKRR